MRLLSVFWMLFAFSFAHADPLRVALVLDKGGKDDKSFNSAAFRGATEAKQKLGIFLKEIETSDDSLYEPAMRSFAAKKFDLIIGIGVSMAETVKKLAKEFPQQKFALIDAPVEAPNVTSAMFEEQEGSYLVGYIAALKSKGKEVGFIGGMDIPLIRRFEKAYVQGVQSVRPDAKVQINYVGVTSEAWTNPTKAKELAQNQYSRGVDIIFAPAGASNNGCFDAAEATQNYAIGVDSNQNWIKPGYILTSMIKHVDTAVFQVIEELTKGTLKPGIRDFGLKNGGIDWALDQYNQKLFSPVELKKIAAVKQSIISGKVHVVDYYKSKK